MQAQVDEIGGNVLGIGPIDRVGEHQRDIMAPQQVHETRFEKARVADFDRMPQGPVLPGTGPGAPGEPVIMALGERGGGFCIARQPRKNASSFGSSKRKRGENCHKKGPSLSSSRNTPCAKKLARPASGSRNCFRCVMKRLPLMAK